MSARLRVQQRGFRAIPSAYCSLSFPQPLSIGTQLVITPADVSGGLYPHLNNTVDDDAANGYFYDHSNAMYSATPDSWAGSDA